MGQLSILYIFAATTTILYFLPASHPARDVNKMFVSYLQELRMTRYDSWSIFLPCPENTYVVGIQTRSTPFNLNWLHTEVRSVSANDSAAKHLIVASLRIICSDIVHLDSRTEWEGNIARHRGEQWSALQECDAGFVTGLLVTWLEVAIPFDTIFSLGNLTIICSDKTNDTYSEDLTRALLKNTEVSFHGPLPWYIFSKSINRCSENRRISSIEIIADGMLKYNGEEISMIKSFLFICSLESYYKMDITNLNFTWSRLTDISCPENSIDIGNLENYNRSNCIFNASVGVGPSEMILTSNKALIALESMKLINSTTYREVVMEILQRADTTMKIMKMLPRSMHNEAMKFASEGITFVRETTEHKLNISMEIPKLILKSNFRSLQATTNLTYKYEPRIWQFVGNVGLYTMFFNIFRVEFDFYFEADIRLKRVRIVQQYYEKSPTYRYFASRTNADLIG